MLDYDQLIYSYEILLFESFMGFFGMLYDVIVKLEEGSGYGFYDDNFFNYFFFYLED